MKKILSILSIVAMVALMTSCGNKQEEETVDQDSLMEAKAQAEADSIEKAEKAEAQRLEWEASKKATKEDLGEKSPRAVRDQTKLEQEPAPEPTAPKTRGGATKVDNN